MEAPASLRHAVLGLALALAPVLALLPLPASAANAAPPQLPVDTVVVAVSADSPVTEISRLHLADLYLGRSSRFEDGRPAMPVDQEQGASARESFYETYLRRSTAEIKAHWSKIIFTGRGRPPRDVPGGEQMRELLADNPRAIGYLDHRLVDGRLRVVEVR